VKEKVLRISEGLKEEIRNWRRHLHQFPEVSGKEEKTAEFVADKLKSFGVDEVYFRFAGTNSVVALIRGEGEKTFGIRADIDALEIEEKTGAVYSSKVKGLMHACGHDAHTAILLGTAKTLTELRKHLKGNVKLIFQSCEEKQTCKGAKHLVESGVLENPKVEAIMAMHVFPEIPKGSIGIHRGTVLASSDVFKITVKGKSTHASKPHFGKDPILPLCQIISGIYQVSLRTLNPCEPYVVSVCKICGGSAENVIPDIAEAEGTLRAVSEETRKKLWEIVLKVCEGTEKTCGVSISVDIKEGSPPVINDPELSSFAKKELKKLIGEEKVIELHTPTLGGEDFSFYTKEIPGIYLRFGVDSKYPLHSSKFDFDDGILWIGSAVESYLAIKWLEG